MADTSDVVVVGGGIAGATMAATLARAGLAVVLLERQATYRDRVRGELIVPWGVAEAHRLGILEVLLEAGGHWLPRRVSYDETISPQEAEAASLPLDRLLPGVSGALSVYHPHACLALTQAATAAGAEVRLDVDSVEVTGGARPEVTYQVDGDRTSVRCRLVIGADGRTSVVRHQAGIRLERGPAPHLVSGLLVDGAGGFPEDIFVLGTEGDVTFFICPQGSARMRLYLCHAVGTQGRFSGGGGAGAFLRSFRLESVPCSDSLATATAAGPCATLEGDDTWTLRPLTEGVALIGDAAGYNNPLIGQGLSLAMRDVRVLSELLLEGRDWSPRGLEPYAAERMERMRRVRTVASALAALIARYTPEVPAQRRRFRERLAADPTLVAPLLAMYAGPETAPAEAFTPDFMERFAGAGVA